ncbi:MAG: V-type ATP synthase subunit E [Chlamydiae bacterium]|nr:V-type ATP synthase subunit E [Chlamydiota bacterium]
MVGTSQMQGLDTGKDKVKKICELLRQETLEPAIKEAEEVIKNAKREADQLIDQAKKKIEKISKEAELEIAQKEKIVTTSLSQACQQTVESLKQSIEEKLFHPKLVEIIRKQLNEPDVIAKLIAAIIKAIEKEGLKTDISVVIAKTVSQQEINQKLGEKILEQLKEKSALIGPIGAGIEVKLHQENITIDLTDMALKDLIAEYIRKDFRKFLFGSL